MNTSSPPPRTETIYNIHVHLFNIDHIPRQFVSKVIPTNLAKTIASNPRLKTLSFRLFKKTLNRYLAFLYSSLRNSQEEILQELRAYYPQSARFAPLSVDFDFMEAGPCNKPFLTQIEELAELKAKHPDTIFPFLGIDPRREGLIDLVKEYIEEKHFTGLKIYPALGFFPDDPRLDEVYQYAEEHQLPITAHCIPKNANHYRGKLEPWMKEKARELESIDDFSEKDLRKTYDFARYWNHPFWYEKVLQRFPNLKINFGHFGGKDEWDKYLDIPYEAAGSKTNWYVLIRQLIKNPDYPNIYADISFTVYDYKLFPLLKNLVTGGKIQDYVLFGSDFYMLQKDYRERRFSMDVRGYLDDDDYWKIAEDNPRRFLTTAFRSHRA